MRRWALVLGPLLLAGCHGSGVKAPSVAMAPALPEIHLDGQCGVRQGMSGAPDATTAAAAVCHLVGTKTSQHVESGHPDEKRTLQVVTIREQEYRLRNTTAGPLAFVVEQALEKGWTVAADSAPGTVQGATAVFRVTADPGQVVRLYVRTRHAVPIEKATGVEYGSELLK